MKKAIALSPRDEHYQFNLANIYMANHKVDEAIALFRSLTGSGIPRLRCARIRCWPKPNFKTQSQTFALRIENRNAENAQPVQDSSVRTDSAQRIERPSRYRVRFMKGNSWCGLF